MSGIGFPTARLAGTILVNRRTTSDVRATVHSFLSQAENLGEIIFGLALAFIAGSASSTVALTASVALLACAGAVVSAPASDGLGAAPRSVVLALVQNARGSAPSGHPDRPPSRALSR